jgi:hypothetical protein
VNRYLVGCADLDRDFRAALHDHRASRLHALAALFPEKFALGMGAV